MATLDIGTVGTDKKVDTSETDILRNQEREDDKALVDEIERSIKFSGDNLTEPSYEATVTLPTRGLLYKEEGIPAEISLRGMTTREEKILYAASGNDTFKKVLKACITSPKDIDLNALLADDEAFLILQLRMITFGDEYKVSATCPRCRNRNEYVINLSEFETSYLPSDFKEPIDIKLPRSGDVISVKLLRKSDTDFIDRYSKRFAKQFNQDVREVEYTVRAARMIKAINGKEVDFIEARSYFENMRSLDSAKMWSVLDSIKFGTNTRCTVNCYDCKRDFDFNMPITSEFFRPTVE